ncbi:pseudouridylate synthase [Mycoplasma haemofelis str. Langford 1]|uniref:RNA pseudouridylate synthase n=1 Tax=Mycoplasma haemofelis (strain Langford 1) TaxID=941640 RepID=E8ZKA6_MYCHL|nr:RluA family pseudouridine synthase [Mycoplasma haemofelis]CBY92072.1 pseudouridylate synthase [Mycoplasma haemofelis str. Langford 1]
MQKIRRTILADFDGYCLNKFLKLEQPSWTKVFIYKMIRKKNITINGLKISDIRHRLKEGDVVEFYGCETPTKPIKWEGLKPLRVVFESENLIIVDKEAKMPVQEDDKHPFNHMNNRLLKHLNYSNREGWKPVFIHRLDLNTTGLLIGAKNYKTFLKLNKSQKSLKIKKSYKALVQGNVSFKKREISCFLLKKDGRVSISREQVEGAKEAKTIANFLHFFPSINSTLLELTLITGRTHQIRAHMSYIKHPIRGDQKYGVEKDKREFPYPALCAYKIEFSEDIDLEEVRGKSFQTEDIWFEKLLKL